MISDDFSDFESQSGIDPEEDRTIKRENWNRQQAVLDQTKREEHERRERHKVRHQMRLGNAQPDHAYFDDKDRRRRRRQGQKLERKKKLKHRQQKHWKQKHQKQKHQKQAETTSRQQPKREVRDAFDRPINFFIYNKTKTEDETVTRTRSFKRPRGTVREALTRSSITVFTHRPHSTPIPD